ncbi:MAG: chemotaxis protein CheW [Planctomycetes bacterium]|nr:chemotaxis protein CheW [Planctomycetota bacterium]
MPELAISKPPSRAFLTFRSSGRLYGLEIAQVREVSMHMDFTPVLQAPSLVRGLANLRSRIYLVLDAGMALGGASGSCTSESRLIVLHESIAKNLGILVEQGGDIIQVPIGQIEDADHAEAENASTQLTPTYVVALCKLEGDMMMVIDPGRIVSALETAIR